jgi:hypothetical protein
MAGKSRKQWPFAARALIFPLLLFALTQLRAQPRITAAQNPGSAAVASTGIFPLAAGTTWDYQAMLSWSEENSTDIHQKLIEWKMEVERMIPRHTSDRIYDAYAIKGFLRGIDGSHGNTTPAESLIVESRKAGDNSTQYYWIPPSETPKALARFENSSDSLAGVVSANELFLEYPLVRGQKFCGPMGMIRTDQFYCWVTGKPETAELSGIEGAPKLTSPVAYPIEFMTTENSTAFDFVPGVGITRYSYQVAGTATDTELTLVAIEHKAH